VLAEWGRGGKPPTSDKKRGTKRQKQRQNKKIRNLTYFCIRDDKTEGGP